MNWRKVNENRKIANEHLYTEVADELGISIDQVRDIVKAQSDISFDIIKRGEFEGMIYPYLGKIQVNAFKIQKVYAQKIRK